MQRQQCLAYAEQLRGTFSAVLSARHAQRLGPQQVEHALTWCKLFEDALLLNNDDDGGCFAAQMDARFSELCCRATSECPAALRGLLDSAHLRHARALWLALLLANPFAPARSVAAALRAADALPAAERTAAQLPQTAAQAAQLRAAHAADGGNAAWIGAIAAQTASEAALREAASSSDVDDFFGTVAAAAGGDDACMDVALRALAQGLSARLADALLTPSLVQHPQRRLWKAPMALEICDVLPAFRRAFVCHAFARLTDAFEDLSSSAADEAVETVLQAAIRVGPLGAAVRSALQEYVDAGSIIPRSPAAISAIAALQKRVDDALSCRLD